MDTTTIRVKLPRADVSIARCWACRSFHDDSYHCWWYWTKKSALGVVKAWWYGVGAIGQFCGLVVLVGWTVAFLMIAYALIAHWLGLPLP